MTPEDELPLAQKLNLETGKIDWPELQRYFARGVVICVNPELDLIRVAEAVGLDQAAAIETYIKRNQLVRASDKHALDWEERRPLFWAVVIAPWVLVQEIKPS